MMYKVCHVTSAHRPFDGRIFERECTSLTKYYDVYLIAPNVEDCEKNGVRVRGVSLPSGRFSRQFKKKDIFKRMIEINADVYHFHEPELIPYGLKIKKRGKKIIFDSHENVPATFLKMNYIPKCLRGFASKCYTLYEKYALKKFDSVVSVTPEIVDRLKEINPNTYMLTNFPIYKEKEDERKWERKIGFAGTVNDDWNIKKIIKAIEGLDVCFELAGWVTPQYLEELKLLPAWNKVNFHGVLKHDDVFRMLQTCSIGMAVSSNTNPNGGYRRGSIGVTKIFEYMKCGIPLIATDKEIWKEIVEDNECGFCVDCDNIEQIREKIEFLLNNTEESIKLGNNGILLVKNQYCWQVQEDTLFKMYSKLLSD